MLFPKFSISPLGSYPEVSFQVRQFIIRLTRDSFISLKRTINEKKIQVLTDVVEDHLLIDQFDGLPRTQQQMYVPSRVVL